jgi:hypothetical protein
MALAAWFKLSIIGCLLFVVKAMQIVVQARQFSSVLFSILA